MLKKEWNTKNLLWLAGMMDADTDSEKANGIIQIVSQSADCVERLQGTFGGAIVYIYKTGYWVWTLYDDNSRLQKLVDQIRSKVVVSYYTDQEFAHYAYGYFCNYHKGNLVNNYRSGEVTVKQ